MFRVSGIAPQLGIRSPNRVPTEVVISNMGEVMIMRISVRPHLTGDPVNGGVGFSRIVTTWCWPFLAFETPVFLPSSWLGANYEDAFAKEENGQIPWRPVLLHSALYVFSYNTFTLSRRQFAAQRVVSHWLCFGCLVLLQAWGWVWVLSALEVPGGQYWGLRLENLSYWIRLTDSCFNNRNNNNMTTVGREPKGGVRWVMRWQRWRGWEQWRGDKGDRVDGSAGGNSWRRKTGDREEIFLM